MRVLSTIRNTVYLSGKIVAQQKTNNGENLAWIECSPIKCKLIWIDFKTGHSFYESTPCGIGNKITFQIIKNSPQLRLEWGAKGDEICRNADGQPAYPFMPEPER
jgi:hypothetical protein